MNKILLIFCLMLLPVCTSAQEFSVMQTNNVPTKRHECGAAIVKDAMYLFGGRGDKPVNRFNLITKTWDEVGKTPLELNHFQAVVYKDEIYVAGAFTGGFPHEKPVAEVYAFSPKTNTWRIETLIPENRRRGSAGAVVYKNKLYLIAGITDGHYDGHVAWMDEYDFATKKWTQLPDAPIARDHFQAVVVNDKLFVAGGRKSSAKTDEVFSLTVSQVDVFDLKKQTWTALGSSNNIPTPRAGSTTVALKDSFIVIGGESGKQEKAHNEAEIFDVKKNKWTKTIRLLQGRHGTQAVIYKKKIYIASGSGGRGGGPELEETEVGSFEK
jgi:N-acetylneuraminic acid mutarotase